MNYFYLSASNIVFCLFFLVSPIESLQIYNLTCPDTGEIYLANPTDCRSYYYCWNGDNFLQYCPRGYYFHLAERRCTTGDIADCGGFVGQPPSQPVIGVSTGLPPVTTKVPKNGKPKICTMVCSSPDAQLPIGTLLRSLCQCQVSRQNQLPPVQPEKNIIESIGKAIDAILKKPQNNNNYAAKSKF